jgi:uncharacterized protein YwqG
MTPKTRDEIRKWLNRRIGIKDTERIAPWLMPTIGFHDGPLGKEPRRIGGTRFGGRPDLPDSIDWPQGPNGPLAFMGQVSLAEAVPFDVDAALPPTGMLYFFYNVYQYYGGYQPEDRKRFRVLYTSSTKGLRRREVPRKINEANRIALCRHVTPYLRWEIPTADHLAKETLDLRDTPQFKSSEVDAFSTKYWKLYMNLASQHIPVGENQLLGWANGIYEQGEDCRLICELAKRNFPKEKSAEAKRALAFRKNWRCLLEVGEDVKLTEFKWGGTVAYMIQSEDLEKRNFDQCWCVWSLS